MWTYNVVRDVIRASETEVIPATVPQSDQAMRRIAEEALVDEAPGRVRVLKVHACCSPKSPRSRFIVPRRDIGDSLLSYMRFMQSDFESALATVPLMIDLVRHYDGFPRDIMLPIEYAAICARPDAVARAIADFLEIRIDDGALSDIARRYSKEGVLEIIRHRENALMQRACNGGPLERDDFVAIKSGLLRAFDAATGFQSGHVTNYPDGVWRSAFTPKQIERIEAKIAAEKWCPEEDSNLHALQR